MPDKRNLILLLVSLLLIPVFLVSCGKSRTEDLLTNKRWNVYDVTPPAGPFDVEKSNRAKELKNGFYKDAWFEFLSDSLFVASFGGKVDTGKYAIRSGGETVALYPRHGNKMYELIQIKELSGEKMKFNTKVADFRMTLHLKAETIE